MVTVLHALEPHLPPEGVDQVVPEDRGGQVELVDSSDRDFAHFFVACQEEGDDVRLDLVLVEERVPERGPGLLGGGRDTNDSVEVGEPDLEKNGEEFVIIRAVLR